MEEKRNKKTAILVDGGYYRVRSRDIWGGLSAVDRANELYNYCLLHITEPDDPRDLYRIFYYDCPPMTRSIKHPLTGNDIDFSRASGTAWSNTLYRCFAEKPKTALRMGELAETTASFVLKDSVLGELLSGNKKISDLREDDFRIDVKQKGVDMRIGLDVASMAAQKIVDQIVLIAGDSDFLPVIKMARKSGIEVLLDPMKQFPKRNMIEHVDGIESYTEKMHL